MTMPRENFPTILLVDGKEVKVEWESLGTIIDGFGDTLEVFMPILPANVLTPDIAESLFNNIRAWNVTQNEPYDMDRVTLLNAKLSPEIIFEEAKLGALRRELVKQGLTPSILGMEGVEELLLNQLEGQRGATLSPNFIKSVKSVTDEIAASPSNAPAILARFGLIPGVEPYYPGQKKLTPEEEAENEAIREVSERSLYYATHGIRTPGVGAYGPKYPTLGSEKEYLQSVLGKEDVDQEEIQKRLAEIEAGSEERWSPTRSMQDIIKDYPPPIPTPPLRSGLDEEFAKLVKKSKKRVSYL